VFIRTYTYQILERINQVSTPYQRGTTHAKEEPCPLLVRAALQRGHHLDVPKKKVCVRLCMGCMRRMRGVERVGSTCG
jgi:hypothetical protein